jgi:hypothetical protein
VVRLHAQFAAKHHPIKGMPAGTVTWAAQRGVPPPSRQTWVGRRFAAFSSGPICGARARCQIRRGKLGRGRVDLSKKKKNPHDVHPHKPPGVRAATSALLPPTKRISPELERSQDYDCATKLRETGETPTQQKAREEADSDNTLKPRAQKEQRTKQERNGNDPQNKTETTQTKLEVREETYPLAHRHDAPISSEIGTSRD